VTVIDSNADTAFILDSSPPVEPEEIPAEAVLNPQALAFAKQIDAKERGLDEADLFAILGVKRDSTPFEIDAAFDTLSRWFALERLEDLGLSHLQSPLLRIREHLRQAYAVLSNDMLRASYLRARFERPRRRRKVRSAA
jgi:hypothetical protein